MSSSNLVVIIVTILTFVASIIGGIVLDIRDEIKADQSNYNVLTTYLKI